MNKKRFVILILILLSLVSGGVIAQYYGGSTSYGGRGGRGGGRSSSTMLPNRGFQQSRAANELFQWDIDQDFSQDVFTFVRIAYNTGSSSYVGSRGSGARGAGRTSTYNSSYRGYGGYGGGRSMTDWPDSDNNFSYRLQQLTSIEVNPEPVLMELTDPELFNYPFIYIVEPGTMSLRTDEITALRKYLLNGGFLMIDDFWDTDEWYNVYTQVKKVFPDREPTVLTLDHPIFHCVFDLKELPQIPAYNYAINMSTDELTGVTSESGYPPVYYGIYDDKGRMMIIICRDTDLGDGWEREGISHTFFSEFSEKKAYPLGINIVFYVMTH